MLNRVFKFRCLILIFCFYTSLIGDVYYEVTELKEKNEITFIKLKNDYPNPFGDYLNRIPVVLPDSVNSMAVDSVNFIAYRDSLIKVPLNKVCLKKTWKSINFPFSILTRKFKENSNWFYSVKINGLESNRVRFLK